MNQETNQETKTEQEIEQCHECKEPLQIVTVTAVFNAPYFSCQNPECCMFLAL